MTKRMLIDSTHAEETRVAVVDGHRLIEFDYESQVRKQLKGSIFLAKVTRVEPSLQASFVNFGGNRHGFLPFSEIHPDYFRIPIADREALLAEQKAMMEAIAAEEAAADAAEEAAMLAAEAKRDAAYVVSEGDVNNDLGLEGDTPEEVGGAVSYQERVEASVDGGVLEEAPTGPSEDLDVVADGLVDGGNDSSDFVEASEEGAEQGSDDNAEEDAADLEDGASEEDADDLAQDDLVAEGGAEGDSENEGESEGDGEGGRDGRQNRRGRRFRGRRQRGGRRSPMQSRRVEVVGGDSAEGSDQPFRLNLRRNYKIQEVIKRGQIMLVQVQKEERGNKGAAVTTYLSLPGRYCVLMPNSPRGGGVSRKIASFAERKRMREILAELSVPEGMSVILRTAGVSRTKDEIKRDLDYLMRLWDEIREQTLQSTAPALIYEESNLVKRAVRDIYASDIDEIWAAGEEGFKEARNFMKMLMPSHVKRVHHYQEERIPLFHRYQVENQIAEIGEPMVTLKSGGYLVINPTEALVSVDVNSGRATKERHIEETALKTNLEAAEEVARQLRLRDLGGLVVIDFIDMEDYRNNAKVERRLKEALSTDRARIQVGRISSFGLLELSRQRLNPSLTEAQYEKCPHCKGAGNVRTTDSSAILALRALEDEGIRNRGDQMYLSVASPVALYILNQKRELLADIERRYDARVFIRVDDSLAPAGYKIESIKTVVDDDGDDDGDASESGSERPQERDRNNNRRQQRDRGHQQHKGNNRFQRQDRTPSPRDEQPVDHENDAIDHEDDNIGNRADVDADARSYESDVDVGRDRSQGRGRRPRGGRGRGRFESNRGHGGNNGDNQGHYYEPVSVTDAGVDAGFDVAGDGNDASNGEQGEGGSSEQPRSGRRRDRHRGRHRDRNRGGRDGKNRDDQSHENTQSDVPSNGPDRDNQYAASEQRVDGAATPASKPQFRAKTFGSRRSSQVAAQPVSDASSADSSRVSAVSNDQSYVDDSSGSKPKKKGWWNKLIE